MNTASTHMMEANPAPLRLVATVDAMLPTLNTDPFDIQSSEERHRRIESAVRSRSCGARVALLPDIDIDSQAHKQQLCKIISSLANSMSYERPQHVVVLVLGAECLCHPHLAAVFSHRRAPFHHRADFADQLRTSIEEYCDPPVETDYELMLIDTRRYGIIQLRTPLSLPVHYLESTPDGQQ